MAFLCVFIIIALNNRFQSVRLYANFVRFNCVLYIIYLMNKLICRIHTFICFRYACDL